MQSQQNVPSIDISSVDVELTKLRLRRKRLRNSCLQAIDYYERSKGNSLPEHRQKNITHLREFLAENNEKYKTADLIALYIKTYTTDPHDFYTGFLGRSDLRKKLLRSIEQFCPIVIATDSSWNLCNQYYEICDALEALIGTIEPLLDEAKKYKELLAEAANSVERTQDALNNLNSIVERDINETSVEEVKVDKATLININNAIKNLRINLAIEQKNVAYYKEQYEKAELKIELLNKSIALKNSLIENLREEIAKKEHELNIRDPKSNQSPGLGPVSVSSHGLFNNSIQLSASFDSKEHPDEQKEIAIEQHNRPSSVPPGIRVGSHN